MAWIRRISHLPASEKEGLYRVLIPPALFHRFKIDPLSLTSAQGGRAVHFLCPEGDATCIVEVRWPHMAEPLYFIQMTDSNDITQLEWDFFMVNDPGSPRFDTHTDKEGKDTLFGWASRNYGEEEKAMNAGLFPGQTRKGLGLTGQAIEVLEFFCRIFDIKSIRIEALFYHNAVTYERHGFCYFSGYRLMQRIHEQFQPGGKIFAKLDTYSPFRRPELAHTVRGRSWAIHDGVLSEIEDDLLEEGWVSPRMYKMVGKSRPMVTFPDPLY